MIVGGAGKAMDDDLTLKQAARRPGDVSEQQFDQVLDPSKMVGNGVAGA